MPDYQAFRAFLATQFLDLNDGRVRFNDDGWHNIVAVVDEKTVFRFARTDWARDLLRREITKLDLIRQYVTLPVPEMTLVGDGIARYPYITGSALYRHHLLALPLEDRDRIAAQLAGYLRDLWRIPLSEIEARGIGWFPGTTGREGVLAHYDEIKAKLYPNMMRYTRAYVDQIFDAALADPDFFAYTPVFVHGDLDAYHMCYDPERRRINGMIDYGVSGLGNPAHDVTVLMDYFGETFIRCIGKTLDLSAVIRQGRFGAFLTGINRTLMALNTGNTAWHLHTLHLARDIMPIDSPWDVEDRNA